MAAERPIALSDRTRLAWTLVRHGSPSLTELERLFGDGRAANQRAYAVASALVRDLLRVHGENGAARVLSLIGEGQGFDDAFLGATGEPLSHALDRFWSRQRLWERWVPFLTGPAFLWTMITMLALFAIAPLLNQCFHLASRSCMVHLSKLKASISQKYTKAYLHHLFKMNEILGLRISTSHNLYFYINLMKTIREKITDGDFNIWSTNFIEKYNEGSEEE